MSKRQNKYVYQQTEINNNCCCLSAVRGTINDALGHQPLLKKQSSSTKKFIKLSKTQIQKQQYAHFTKKLVHYSSGKDQIKLSKVNNQLSDIFQTKITLQKQADSQKNANHLMTAQYYFQLPKQVAINHRKNGQTLQSTKKSSSRIPYQQINELKKFQFPISEHQLVYRKIQTQQFIDGVSQIKENSFHHFFNIPKSVGSEISGMSQLILKIQNMDKCNLQQNKRGSFDGEITPRKIYTGRKVFDE